MFSSEMRKGALLLSLPVLAYGGMWRYASRNERFASDVHQDARLAYGQSQTVRGTKVLRDTRDHISFSYPATYEVDKAAAARWQKESKARHSTAHIVAWFSDRQDGANIIVVIVPVPFDLDYIRKGAPTGMSDSPWLKFTAFGDNKFYFYRGGNQSVQHPNSFYYNLNNTILTFVFDGPYSTKFSVLPDPQKVGPVETLVLGSLKAPVERTSSGLPGSFYYTNKQYGFRLTLNGAWKGYEVSQQTNGNITYLIFSVPAQRRNRQVPWLRLPPRMNLLYLGVQSPQAWARRRSHCRFDCGVNSAPSMFNDFGGATVIARTKTTVFSLERWDADRTRYHVNRVIESFTLLH